MKPLITINDNGNVVTREMTDEEFEQVLADEAYYNELKATLEEAAAKKAAAEAKLASLGLTTDDLKALGLN